ncbi:hypothetical protein K449DRAFT_469788 [Hypoxylon sp. EC38]|nr:hypothetical protein K449DRAFT_469788 [Hypoxylon sp. EC38]
MGKNEKPEQGDKVSWNWGGGAPSGTVAEVEDKGAIEIKTKRGNTVKRNADPNNPAVRIKRSGNDVAKRSSELTVEEKNIKDGKAGSKLKSKGQIGHDEIGNAEESNEQIGEDFDKNGDD